MKLKATFLYCAQNNLPLQSLSEQVYYKIRTTIEGIRAAIRSF